MDAFQRIAKVFTEYCQERLSTIERVNSIVDSSETVAKALQKIFAHTEIYPDDYEHLRTIKIEMERLRNCIDSMEETIEHSRRIFAINFNTSDKFLVFNQEICFAYVCKTLNSVGPRLHHFSNSPTNEEVVNAELHLAFNSPYTFKDVDLFCYESMPLSGETEHQQNSE